VVQVAFSLGLLMGAGLLIESLERLGSTPLGMAASVEPREDLRFEEWPPCLSSFCPDPSPLRLLSGF
jgi:hypothetical protein